MKKIVVVAKGKEIVFTGENLKVTNKNEKTQTPSSSSILMVEDENEVIAVFKRWSYWREINTKGSSKPKTELTYGELSRFTLVDEQGIVQASLFIYPDGTLACDSWIRYLNSDHEGKTEPETLSITEMLTLLHDLRELLGISTDKDVNIVVPWIKIVKDRLGPIVKRTCLHCAKRFMPKFEKQRFCEKHLPRAR